MEGKKRPPKSIFNIKNYSFKSVIDSLVRLIYLDVKIKAVRHFLPSKFFLFVTISSLIYLAFIFLMDRFQRRSEIVDVRWQRNMEC